MKIQKKIFLEGGRGGGGGWVGGVVRGRGRVGLGGGSG